MSGVENLNVTIPVGLKERCREAAQADGRNLSNFVANALKAYLQAEALTSRRTP